MKHHILSIILLCFWSSSYLVAQDFKPGYYYDKYDQKHEGLLKHRLRFSKRFSTNIVIFKESANSTEKRLTTNEMNAFVIEKDSFALFRNIRFTEMMTFKDDFAKVIENGRLDLFRFYNRGADGVLDIKPRNARKVYGVYKNGKHALLRGYKDYTKVLPTFMQDAPDLAKKINIKLYRDATQLQALIQEYNAREAGANEVSGYVETISYYQPGTWQTGLENARKRFGPNKVYILYFYTDMCKPCLNFEAHLNSQEVIDALKDAILVKVDVDQDEKKKEIYNTYGVTNMPTFIKVNYYNEALALITASEWQETTPNNIAHTLKKLVDGEFDE